MELRMNYERSIRCSCIGGEHYIHFSVVDDESQIYVDLCARGNLPFILRIKEVVKILRGQHACYDGIILDKEKSEEIIQFLQEIWKEKEKK